MLGLAVVKKYGRRLAPTILALVVAAIVSSPAAAQAPRKGFLTLDKNGQLVWVYYTDAVTTVTVPASREDLRRWQAMQGQKHGVLNGRGAGRHYTVGSNRTGGTKTQTWHVGERVTGQRGGSNGRRPR